ncbi:hypothetical protein FF38_13598 [Lucilia cuprina]|uniref:Uncharacterized protein n=1 Tax=Lucilia cuprina TaxID=7375 RepID=A0A0L0BTC2_LUCCU|nr:hypothetical protein FF38_13598 [Lucilia cuprina]
MVSMPDANINKDAKQITESSPISIYLSMKNFNNIPSKKCVEKDVVFSSQLKMVRNNQKFLDVLNKEISMGLDLETLKYYTNTSIFDKIFADYNKDQPTCYKLANNTKNRKMVLKNLKSLKEKIENTSKHLFEISDNQNIPFENTSNISNLFEELNNLESTQLRVKLPQQNYNTKLTEDEKCALEALITLFEGPEIENECATIDVSKVECFDSKANSIERILEYLKEEIETKPEILEISNTSKKEFESNNKCFSSSLFRLDNMSNRNNTVVNQFQNKISKSNLIKQNCTNLYENNKDFDNAKEFRNYSMDYDIVSPILDKENMIIDKVTKGNNKSDELSIDSDKSGLLEKDKILGPFEITDSSLDLSRFESYQKIPNPDEKSNRSVVRLPASGLLAYGYCTFPDCCKYRFKINLDESVSVHRTGEIYHGKDQNRVGQIHGVKRAIVKKALKNKKGYVYRKEQILKASDGIAQTGNFQDIHNLSMLRKCKSHGKYDNFYDDNPLMSIKCSKDYMKAMFSM